MVNFLFTLICNEKEKREKTKSVEIIVKIFTAIFRIEMLQKKEEEEEETTTIKTVGLSIVVHVERFDLKTNLKAE